MVEEDEARDDANRLTHFFWILRMEGHPHGGLRSSLEHVLALFIETGRHGVPFLECNQQGRQRRAIVIALFDEVARWMNPNAGELLQAAQALDP